jgi:hypothetical protein
MSQEVRHILFTDAEIAAAAVAWLRRGGQRLEVQWVTGVAVRAPDGEIEAELIARRGDETPIALPTLRGSELAAALIAFCGQRRIPLPRRAPKRLALFDGRLMLTVVRNAQTGEPRVADGAVVYDDPTVRALSPRAA